MISQAEPIAFEKAWYEAAQTGHFWFEWRLRALMSQLLDLNVPLDARLSVLDVGCGEGVLCSQLEGLTDWTIDLADLNMEALEKATTARGRKLYYDVTEKRPELVNSYDIVILFDVLEHMPFPEEFLASAFAHVKDGGLVLVNVPALPMFLGAYDIHVGHLRRYTRRMLLDQCDFHRFELKDLRYWGFSLVPLLALRKLLVHEGQDSSEVVGKGFGMPSPIFEAGLRLLMNIETGLAGRFPIGSSLLMACSKA